jgi:opacity protein-like surface antigen
VAAGGLSATIADDDGFDIFYGFGVKIKISEQLSAVAEYENYGFDDDDVELFTAGIQLTF